MHAGQQQMWDDVQRLVGRSLTIIPLRLKSSGRNQRTSIWLVAIINHYCTVWILPITSQINHYYQPLRVGQNLVPVLRIPRTKKNWCEVLMKPQMLERFGIDIYLGIVVPSQDFSTWNVDRWFNPKSASSPAIWGLEPSASMWAVIQGSRVFTSIRITKCGAHPQTPFTSMLQYTVDMRIISYVESSLGLSGYHM